MQSLMLNLELKRLSVVSAKARTPPLSPLLFEKVQFDTVAYT